MIKQLENEIRDLQKEMAEIRKDQAVLRLQPCREDSEIREKDVKFDELGRRTTIIRETIRDLARKRQLLISEPTKRRTYDSHCSDSSSLRCLWLLKGIRFPPQEGIYTPCYIHPAVGRAGDGLIGLNLNEYPLLSSVLSAGY